MKCSNVLTSRAFVCLVVLLLVAMGPIITAVDLTFLTDFINSLRMGDFYTYIAFIMIISVWSIYGLAATFMGSLGGITIYMIGLVIGLVVTFLIGFIHIMALFISYRPILMNSCLQRDPSRLFWWSLGFDDTAEMKRIYQACQSQWSTFATERIASWVAYSVLSAIATYFVVKYQRMLAYQHRKEQSILEKNGSSSWSDDEEEIKSKERSQSVTYHHVEFPSSPNEKSAPESPMATNPIATEMYQQRQRLFDEIAKRKRARKNLNRKSLISNPNRNSVLVVHPLDLTQDPEVYTPPPMPPTEPGKDSASWNRYNEDGDSTIKEDEEAIERQKRLNALSAERMEYEMYRSDEVSSTSGSVARHLDDNDNDDASSVGKGSSHRKRPKSGRWSQVYSDNSIFKPLTTLNQQYSQEGTKQEEEGEEDEEEKANNGSEEQGLLNK